MLDRWTVATFRYEQISLLLEDGLSRSERRQLLKEKTKEPLEWPQSEEDRKAGKKSTKKKISHSTLKRWLVLYREQGIAGLLPKKRKDEGRQKTISDEVLDHALGLLWEEPERSLTQLLVYLEFEFPDVPAARSSLHRHLLAHPAYDGIVKLRKGKKKPRDLYETSHPHESWQLDGKGPFTVRLKSNKRIRVCVLTVIDCFSRKVLATIVARAEDTPATVRVFRIAAALYGLPDRIQFDQGSAFNSHIFRAGIAILGVHRNPAKPSTPEWQGIIEAFHRVLNRWFVQELRHQEVVDLEHLEELLQATIELLYNERHVHRSLNETPNHAFAGAYSPREVSADNLLQVFWGTQTAISHAKTGEVILPNGNFRVPGPHAGKKRTFRFDPVETDQAVLVLKDKEIHLEPFRKKKAFQNDRCGAWGNGNLQKICDVWRGQKRPNTQPGFGLPEVLRELSGLVGHRLPLDTREAETVSRFYRKYGPLPGAAFIEAIDKTARALGEGRALTAYLKHLERLIRKDQNSSAKEKKE